jgi:hypothetical protein
MSRVTSEAGLISLPGRALDQMADVIAAIDPARRGGLATPFPE